MAEKSTQTGTRTELERTVKQQIMLSIGLKFEEKDQLLNKLPSLSDEQLSQLKNVFDQEQQRKEKMLSDFFAKNPKLFPDFERFSQKHVGTIYHAVENEEKSAENKRAEELLHMTF